MKKMKVSCPRIDGTKFDAKRIKDFNAWRKDLEWLLKEELPIAEFDIQKKDFERIAWNIAYMVVTD